MTSDSGLHKVLSTSEELSELLTRSAGELFSVNTGIKQELADNGVPRGIGIALGKSEAIQGALKDASQKLMALSRVLVDEVRDRIMLDHILAAALEQEGGARFKAFHDHLTGLPNRALFLDRLEHGIAQATRHKWMLAVMFVDLGKFKRINDQYGHDAGDAVLQTIATRLKETTREEDTVSRHGGDEFLYLLTQMHNEADIAMIAAKILDTISLPCSVSVEGRDVSPSIEANIGIALFPKHGATADSLIKSADLAMYRAKSDGLGYAFVE